MQANDVTYLLLQMRYLKVTYWLFMRNSSMVTIYVNGVRVFKLLVMVVCESTTLFSQWFSDSSQHIALEALLAFCILQIKWLHIWSQNFSGAISRLYCMTLLMVSQKYGRWWNGNGYNLGLDYTQAQIDFPVSRTWSNMCGTRWKFDDIASHSWHITNCGLAVVCTCGFLSSASISYCHIRPSGLSMDGLGRGSSWTFDYTSSHFQAITISVFLCFASTQ
jgi:hypothetical protein